MKPINIFIIDDDKSIHLLLKQNILTQNKDVDIQINAFESLVEFLDTDAPQADIIILDHFLGFLKGVDAIPLLLKTYPSSHILILSSQQDISVFSQAFARGAKTYIKKNSDAFNKINDYIKKYVKYNEEKEKGFWETFFKGLKKEKLKGSKNLVLIDDDEIVLFWLDFFLSENIDLNVETYPSLEDFELQCINPPDTIAIDYYLGDRPLNKDDVRRIKEKYPKSKIVMLSSALKDVEKAEKFLDYGMDAFLQKNKECFKKLEKIIFDTAS